MRSTVATLHARRAGAGRVHPPWSLLLFATLVATPARVSFALGQPGWAAYFTLGMLIFPVPLAVGILLIRVVRELHDARLALAEQAFVLERLRIDEEVRESVGARLAAITAQGRRAAEMAALDPSVAVREMRALVEDARRTLAETRRMVTRYREVSLLAELKTVATLLSTAGVDTRLELPPDLPDGVDERDRASLQREVARLLGETAPATTVTIAVPPYKVACGSSSAPYQSRSAGGGGRVSVMAAVADGLTGWSTRGTRWLVVGVHAAFIVPASVLIARSPLSETAD